MIGLIYKDLCNLKRYMKQILLIIVVFTIIFSLQGGVDISFFSSYTLLLCTMIVISSISYDDMAKWDKYALTMPISRSLLIGSKYVLGLLMAVAANVLTLILFFATARFNGGIGDMAENFSIMLTMSALGLIVLGIMLPLLIKYGAEKARMMVILVVLIPTAAVLILSHMGISLPDEVAINSLLYVIPFAAIVVYVVSYLLSVRIATKKEY